MKVTVEIENVQGGFTYSAIVETDDPTINQARMVAVATTTLETLTNPNDLVVQRAVR